MSRPALRSAARVLAMVAAFGAACALAGRAGGQAPGGVPALGPATAPAVASRPTDPLSLAIEQANERLELLRIANNARPEPVFDPEAQTRKVAAIVAEVLPLLDGPDTQLADDLARLGADRSISPAAAASRRRELLSQRCELAMLRGELYRRAAAAIADGQDRAGLIAKASDVFGKLRIDYKEVPLGLMGYIGEARTQRLAGKPEAALSTLNGILSIPESPADRPLTEIRRAALLERLEALLLTDPSKAATDATVWLLAPEVRKDPSWQARIQWVQARVDIALLERGLADKTPEARLAPLRQRPADLLRREAVSQVAGAYDRLSALEKLDRLSGGSVLTREEVVQLAGILASADRAEALGLYQRARGSSGGPLAADEEADYLLFLARQGQCLPAADGCDKLLGVIPAQHPRRDDLLELRVACLLKLTAAQGAGGPGDPLRVRLLGALAEAVESGLPTKDRREAMEQWVVLQSRATSLADCVRMIAIHPGLAEGSGYLLYAQAAGQWQAVSAALVAEGMAKDEAQRQTKEVLATLAKARAAEMADNDQPLLAREVLLRAMVLSGPPTSDPRAALQVLTESWDSLKDRPNVSSEAAWLRIQLLLELGLVDEAGKLLAALPEASSRPAGSPGQSPALMPLQLAEALAQRYAAAAPAARAGLQSQVLALCNQSLTRAVADAKAYPAAVLRAGKAMMDVQAHSHAEPVLRELLKSPVAQNDAKLTLEASLLLAQAVQGDGKLAEAAESLAALAGRSPQEPRVFLAQGQCLMLLRRAEPAADAFRQARKLEKPGNPGWCGATIGLAEALLAAGHREAATDIVRVSLALYPTFGNADLLARVRQTQEKLSGPGGGSTGSPR